jgi:hypothetical protein
MLSRNSFCIRREKRYFGGGSNPLIRIFPSSGGRGQGRGEIRDVCTLPRGRGVFFNGFDPLPIFSFSLKQKKTDAENDKK